MKAKIIKTGEIVDVYHEPQHGQTTNIYKEAVLVNGRMWEEDKLDFSINSEVKEVDLDFEQELYKAFGQVRDFTLGMRIAKHFFELGMSVGNKAQKGE